MKKLYTLIPLILIVIGMNLQSCKKTEIEYEKSPLNGIMRFTVLGSEGDSTRSLINGDSITIYWNPDVALPTNITPHIILEEGATISPASGQQVPFNKTTVYTVTAQNGTVKTYWLNPSKKIPYPVVALVTQAAWITSTQLNISGEYFLANADTANISVYMQRVSDGFEFPLEMLKPLTTNYSIRVNLPKFSAQHDIGQHRLYVKTGSRIATPYNVNMLIPPIENTTRESDFLQKGKDIHPGDTLTVTYTATDNFSNKIANYYSAGGVQSLLLFIDFDNMIPVTNFTVSGNTIRLVVPESMKDHIGKSISQCRLLFKAVPQESNTSYMYRHDISFMETPSKIVAR